MISEETFKSFQETVKQEYGKELTIEEAREVLIGWVNYFDLLAKIHHRDQMAKKEEESLSSGNAPKTGEHLEDVL